MTHRRRIFASPEEDLAQYGLDGDGVFMGRNPVFSMVLFTDAEYVLDDATGRGFTITPEENYFGLPEVVVEYLDTAFIDLGRCRPVFKELKMGRPKVDLDRQLSRQYGVDVYNGKVRCDYAVHSIWDLKRMIEELELCDMSFWAAQDLHMAIDKSFFTSCVFGGFWEFGPVTGKTLKGFKAIKEWQEKAVQSYNKYDADLWKDRR